MSLSVGDLEDGNKPLEKRFPTLKPSFVTFRVVNPSLGTYDVSFAPTTAGVVLIHVCIQVTPISSSPFKVIMYSSEEERLANFPGADAAAAAKHELQKKL